MLRSSKRSALIAALAAVLAVAGNTIEIDAHKAVTSPYTYNGDIFQILRDSCSRCHVEGGPAPMGLMTWNDGPNSATPWAESIRQSIVGEQMPPWYVDPKGPAVKGGFGMGAMQSDRLLTWTTGGTPEGDVAKKPDKVSYQARWSGGPPDLKLQIAEYVMPSGENDTTAEFVVPTGLKEQRWLKAVDLLPGSPEIVRNASISIESGAVVAVWVPGDNLISAPAGTAFRLPAGANLRLQIHYKKQWQNEGKTIMDRSTIGLYFTTRPALGREIQSVIGPTLSVKGRVVAVRPSLDRVYGTLTVQAITPAGATVPLLKLRAPRPEWRRRYWLAESVDLPAGTRIEVKTSPAASYVDLSGAKFMKTYPLEVVLDFVPGAP
jgi:hypothetical protein